MQGALAINLGVVVHPPTREIVAEGLRQEAEAGDAAAVLKINTPGERF